MSYKQTGHRLEIRHDDRINYTAELTEYITLPTFRIPFESLFDKAFFEARQLVHKDGFIEEYTGSATFIYELAD